MKPSAEPAFARSNVSATMTWLMQAAASLLSGGGLATPGMCRRQRQFLAAIRESDCPASATLLVCLCWGFGRRQSLDYAARQPPGVLVCTQLLWSPGHWPESSSLTPQGVVARACSPAAPCPSTTGPGSTGLASPLPSPVGARPRSGCHSRAPASSSARPPVLHPQLSWTGFAHQIRGCLV